MGCAHRACAQLARRKAEAQSRRIHSSRSLRFAKAKEGIRYSSLAQELDLGRGDFVLLVAQVLAHFDNDFVIDFSLQRL